MPWRLWKSIKNYVKQKLMRKHLRSMQSIRKRKSENQLAIQYYQLRKFQLVLFINDRINL